MGQPTQSYKRSLSGSVGAGMRSVFGGEGRRFYTLVHKVSSKYHQAGEAQQIIVDEIEIGRDSRCQVRFDDKFDTVSRRHAAIVKDGDNWKLVQLSQTNSTYLNGHRVQKEWYLQNGDEIQLSTNGPKLGFIIPEGKKGLVSSIGLTARLNLFRQQALRPYKQAITALSCVLLLVVGLGTWKILDMDKALVQKSKEIAELIKINEGNKVMVDSLSNELIATNQKMKDYEKRIEKLRKESADAVAAAIQAAQQVVEIRGGGEAINSMLSDQCFPWTYAIIQEKVEIIYPSGKREVQDYTHDKEGNSVTAVVGTGFLLSDGRFITARHVTETWYYYYSQWSQVPKQNEQIQGALMFQNIIAANGGEVVAHFKAVSNTGQTISFTSKQCVCNRSSDKKSSITIEDGTSYVVQQARQSTSDWACLYNAKQGGLPFDARLSTTLPVGTKLQILGFPNGRGAEDDRHPSPISSHSEVARQGLDVDGTIMTSNDDTQSGNSGGPVFAFENGKYTVVGILSGSTGGKGRVVPINIVPEK